MMGGERLDISIRNAVSTATPKMYYLSRSSVSVRLIPYNTVGTIKTISLIMTVCLINCQTRFAFGKNLLFLDS